MRVPLELRRAYKLHNHGPTTLVTSAAHGRTHVMAAAWAMPPDFEPPKVAAVIEEEHRSVHHVAGGLFFTTGERVRAHKPEGSKT